MEKTQISVGFNFCLKPVLKENIVRINIVTEDSFSVKDALKKAINEFNVQNTFFKIKEEFYLYQLRLPNKSGLPNTELPSIIVI
jgi:hypothetical protein